MTFALEDDPDPPFEFVPVDDDPQGHPVSAADRARILVDVVHDGDVVPPAYRERVDPAALQARYIRERDWGASLVAGRLAAALGLGGFFRVRLARVLLDFNRFPGVTPPGAADHLDRRAINPPFDELDHDAVATLLEDYYDRISRAAESALEGKLIKIAIHTYDEHNPSRTRRPDLSLINRCASYQRDSRMPFGVFDPMYPEVLGESTCNRALMHRISLNMERAGYRMGHNHPYLLPEGSIEVRTQVWYFFRFLRSRYEAEHPDSATDPAFELAWKMLQNTNQRLAEAESLRGYLHGYHRVAEERLARFRAAKRAYQQIRAYVEQTDVVRAYRRSPERPSSFTVEVRKDLVCDRDPDGEGPARLCIEREAEVTRMARTLAGAIATYLDTDVVVSAQSEAERRG